MTTLIVEPLDMTQKGSYRSRKAVLLALSATDLNSGFKGSMAARAQALLDVQELVERRCTTDDGSPVEEALDELSGDQFNELMQGMLGEPVPPPSAGS